MSVLSSVSCTTTRRPLLAVLLGVVLATAACAGNGPTASPSSADTVSPTSTAAAGPVSPAEFADVIADEDVTVINVHVPDAGSIEGTDAAIPYDQIRSRSAELPQDLGAPLAVYCRSGRMSAEAVATLRDLGYTDVVELRGGMDAWVADGRELLPPAG